MEPRSYSLESLRSYRLPATGSGETGIAPLNPLRISSYLHNPRADPADQVLFEMHHEGRIIAFRTLLPDQYQDQRGEAQRFAWLSGNYVAPEFRRKGVSTRLLQLAEEAWNGRLMYTNYAPASRAVYDRTGRFRLLTRREGRRYYMRAAAGPLLGDRIGGRKFLSLGDTLVNSVVERRLARFGEGRQDSDHALPVEGFDGELAGRIDAWQADSLFRRDAATFKWILDHPWVTDRPAEMRSYPFTYIVPRFENLLLKFESAGGEVTGFLWMMIRDRQLTVPYVFSRREELFSRMAEEVVRTMVHYGCTHTAIRDPLLAEGMNRHRRWFLLTRSMPQLLFAHRKLADGVPGYRLIRDGDGDVAFTG